MIMKFSKSDFWDYFAVLMILLASKSSYSLLAPLLFLVLFLASAFVYHECKQNTFKFNDSILFLVLLYCLYFFNAILYGSVRITFFAFSLGSFLIISNISLKSFREKYFNIAFSLSVLSLITYVAMTTHLISPVSVDINQDAPLWHYYGFNFVSPSNWSYMHRNSGIYHEPGSFQMVLNFALLFALTAENQLRQISHYRLKFLVILAAIFFTKSTNAYIGTTLILIYVFREKILEKKILLIPLFLVLLGMIYYVVTSDVIVGKFSAYNTASGSAYIRVNDNIACLKMFLDHPFIGVGVGDFFQSLSNKYGNTTSSNGILAELARLGIFWGILYFMFFIKGVKKLCKGNRLFIIFFSIVSVILFSNEDMMGYPIAYFMIFPFKNCDGKKDYV